MSGSTITARLAVASCTLLLVACANNVVVQGDFPAPLMEKLPCVIGVYYEPEFRNHELFDEAAARAESDWLVRTGAAQVAMYNALLPGMFEKIVLLDDRPEQDWSDVAGIDAVLVPHVEELQYAVPRQTGSKVFEIWLRYRYELYAPNGELLADWSMTSYGKTPTAFLQSAAAAVNLAAVVALRDAGANFAMNFATVPEVKHWMESLNRTGQRTATPSGVAEGQP